MDELIGIFKSVPDRPAMICNQVPKKLAGKSSRLLLRYLGMILFYIGDAAIHRVWLPLRRPLLHTLTVRDSETYNTQVEYSFNLK